MIIKKENMVIEPIPNVKNGTGILEFMSLPNPETMINCTLFTKITIPINSSVGTHIHLNETEYYYLLSGTGLAINDGIETQVTVGDVVVTTHNEEHSILNNGYTDLVFLAIIITH